MELNNQFEVDRPIDETWVVLTDVERIAPCLPGAQLEEIEGDEYRGLVKVKVGPITAQYKGKATFVEKDDAAKRAVLRAEGRDSRGQGNASALITAQLTSVSSDRTKVVVDTDLTVTGKVAQFGRGVMADVSEKLLGQFVTNLEARVLSQEPSSAGAAGSSAGTASTAPSGAASTASSGTAASGSSGSSGSSAPSGPSGPSASSGGGAPGSAGGYSGTPSTGSTTPPSGDPLAASARTSGGGAPSSAGTASAPSATAEPATATGSVTTNGSPTNVRKIAPTEPVEPVDLLGATGAPLAKRLAPVLGVVFVLWVLARLRRRRH